MPISKSSQPATKAMRWDLPIAASRSSISRLRAINLFHSVQNHGLRFIPVDRNMKIPKEAYVEAAHNGAPWDMAVCIFYEKFEKEGMSR